MLWMRVITIWTVMLIAMVCNGGFRDSLLNPRLGDLPANQLSVLTGCLLLLAITAAFWRWLRIDTLTTAWAVGSVWLTMTLLFEFGFGRYLRGASWQTLLHDYDILHGRFWPIVLLTTLLAPRLMAWWRGLP